MTKHIFTEVLTPWEFDQRVKLGKRKYSKGVFRKKIHPLHNIHNKLDEYYKITFRNKANVAVRWKLLREIAQLCIQYAGSKPTRKQLSQKVQTVRQLGNLATIRVALESERARGLAARLNAPTGGRGVNVGVKHERELRFERVIKPGQYGARGDDLLQLANDYGIQLTGSDATDYYAMKKLLKIARTNEANRLQLIYMSQEQRDVYRLIFDEDQNLVLDINGVPRHTVDSRGSLDLAMYSASMDGTIYAETITRMREQYPKFRLGKTQTTSTVFHHSSFLAGETALCAGTIKIDRGRLIEITNESGHYTPGLKDLVSVCEAILETGYNPRDDGYALFIDFDGKTFPQIRPNALLRIPLGLFVADKGRPYRPEDFSVDNVLGDYFYTDPVAARNRGCKEHSPKTGSLMAQFA